MKKLLITALCFISVINAADETEMTFYAINSNGQTFKGHTLNEQEDRKYNFVGMARDEDRTIILAQNRGPFHPFCNGEHFVLYSYSENQNKLPTYIEYFGGSFSASAFRPSDPNDLKHTYKALTLLQLYTSIHAKRTLSLENGPISESEKSKSE